MNLSEDASAEMLFGVNHLRPLAYWARRKVACGQRWGGKGRVRGHAIDCANCSGASAVLPTTPFLKR